MKIETKIEFKDYLRLMYILTYRRPGMIIASIMGLFMFVFTLLYLVGIIQSAEFPWLPLAFSLVILLIMPLVIFSSAKKNYKTHGRLQEKITYEISRDIITIIGESFNSQMTWDKTYKVLELNDWFLFYQNKLVANIIPKKFIGAQTQELREIIKQQNVKYKLKNN